MLAMIVKEFRQVGRDKGTLALLIVMPVLLLLVFGYAASFDVDEIHTLVVGPQADLVAGDLPDIFLVEDVDTEGDRADGEAALVAADAHVAFVTEEQSVTAPLTGLSCS